MKILVIGNGFIGTSIIRKLESEGHELLIYTRTKKPGVESQQVTGDIFNFDDFVMTLSWKPQVVIHTAWVTSYELYKTDPLNYRHADFTSKLAKKLLHTDVEHLLILGSCAEYGPQSIASTAGITKLNPKNLYAQQKVIAFNSAAQTLLGSNTRLTWARVFFPYGPNQDKRRLVPYLINSLKDGEQVDLVDTSSVLDWITTRDISSAISWMIKNDTPTEVDIGTTIGYTNLDLIRHLEKLLGCSGKLTPNSSQVLSENFVSRVGIDSPLLESGWRPEDDLISGLDWVINT
jgi:nucleoside-diphosphate-sugar epimerase